MMAPKGILSRNLTNVAKPEESKKEYVINRVPNACRMLEGRIAWNWAN